MPRLTESAIEDFAIKLFERSGYGAFAQRGCGRDGIESDLARLRGLGVSS